MVEKTVVGSLHYATTTKPIPKIRYSVNEVCPYLSQPPEGGQTYYVLSYGHHAPWLSVATCESSTASYFQAYSLICFNLRFR
jgi:hypothetical protein